MSMRLSQGLPKTGVLVSQGESRVTGIEGVVHRVRQRERRHREESMVDKLTGLQNQDQWVMARPRIDQDATLYILRLDVDRFKEINDTLGHAAGNSYLQFVARTIIGVCEVIGISRRHQFRSGGDEFTVVGSAEELKILSVCLRRCINDIGLSEPGTLSMGIGPTDEYADANMYTDKRSSKNEQS